MSNIKTTKEFEQAYSKLNPEQKLAVETIEGPVMVVAGPGTGKTQTIALRIANILKSTDIRGHNILALTFTDSGAIAMKERLFGLIGNEAYRVKIYTFHSFCLSVIQENPDSFFFDLGSEPLSELDKIKIIHRAIDCLPLSILRPIGSPYHYLSSVIKAISDCKREGVSPTQLTGLLDEEEEFLNSDNSQELKKTELNKRQKNLLKNRELVSLFEYYQKELKLSHRYDFDDMVTGVVESLESDQDLLLTYQEQFQYILVDEYQDTNNSQNKLIMLLASHSGEMANIFVTGDPDQSIMRFQGASIANQLSFIHLFPRAKVITLKQNYRSIQSILDCADSLISHNKLRINDVVPHIDSHLHSQNSSRELVEVITTTNQAAELGFIVSDIKSRLEEGASPKQIAVIYRKNSDATALTQAFTANGIDYQIKGGTNILTSPTAINLLNIFKVIEGIPNSSEDLPLFTIMHTPCFSLNPLDILKISRMAGEQNLHLLDVLTADDLLKELKLISHDRLIDFRNLLLTLTQINANETLPTTFEHILKDTGYLDQVLSKPNATHALDELNSLFDLAKNLARQDHTIKINEFLANLSLMESNHLPIQSNLTSESDRSITLTTAHKSKGLEWDYVYIYRSVDGVWGNNKKPSLITLPPKIIQNTDLSTKDDNEEERCLFYVAMTRARTNLKITAAQNYTVTGQSKAAIISTFVAELGDSNLKYSAISSQNPAVPSGLSLTNKTTPANYLDPEKEADFLRPLVKNFKLSATSLNSYLNCPYKFKLEKILRLPQAKKPHLTFGTAVHRALQLYYQRLHDDSSVKPTLEFLITSFNQALARETISPQDFAIRSKQGENILTAYYHLHHNDPNIPIYLEKFSQVQLGKYTLTGKIDRIEWANEQARTIRVIDYKTGHSKTIGQIMGTTQDSNGDLLRQLVFYKLLIDLDSRMQGITLEEAALDFVEEPLINGKDGLRKIHITQEQLADLKQTIESVMQEIEALHFPRTTDLSHCEKCPFRNHCYPNGLPTSVG